VFLEKGAGNTLWLRPGRYRLRSMDATGRVLAEREQWVPPVHSGAGRSR
jgi:hypothetical protein